MIIKSFNTILRMAESIILVQEILITLCAPEINEDKQEKIIKYVHKIKLSKIELEKAKNKIRGEKSKKNKMAICKLDQKENALENNEVETIDEESEQVVKKEGANQIEDESNNQINMWNSIIGGKDYMQDCM